MSRILISMLPGPAVIIACLMGCGQPEPKPARIIGSTGPEAGQRWSIHSVDTVDGWIRSYTSDESFLVTATSEDAVCILLIPEVDETKCLRRDEFLAMFIRELP